MSRFDHRSAQVDLKLIGLLFAFALGIVVFMVLASLKNKGVISETSNRSVSRNAATPQLPQPKEILEVPQLPLERPDYVAILNSEASRNVISDNNAAIAAIRFVGADVIPEKTRGRFFELLGIEVPDREEAVIEWDEFATAKKMRESRRDSIKSLLWQPKIFSIVDIPELVEYILANNSQLDRLGEGLKRSEFFLPLVPAGEYLATCLMEEVVERFEHATTLLDLRCQYRWQTGDVDGAIDDFVTLVRLNRHLSHLPLDLESPWYTINHTQMESFYPLISGAKFSDEQLVRLRSLLKALPEPADPVDLMNRFRRRFAMDAVYLTASDSEVPENTMRFSSETDVGNLLFRVNQAFDNLCDAANTKDLSSRSNAIKGLAATFEKSTRIPYQDRNSRRRRPRLEIGETHLVREFYPDPQFILDGDRARLTSDLMDVAIALQRFRVSHGTYPESMDEIVPELLREIPKDMWTNTPLKYVRRMQFYTLYSCGPNGLDELGRQKNEFTLFLAADDVRFGFAPPTPTLFSEMLKPNAGQPKSQETNAIAL